MSAMRTPQGIESRRRFALGLLTIIVAYTLAFAMLWQTARGLFGADISERIADATSVWVEVPEESADLYRLQGWRYQEGFTANGNPQFRDLSDYRHIVGIIEGPVTWSLYAAGLVILAVWWASRCAGAVDELAHAVSRAALGDGDIRLSPQLAAAGEEFERLAAHIEARELAVRAAETRKNELVAYLAHDIKTPLTSVIGYLALLAEEPDLPRDRRERYAASALDRARKLDAMMDEFFEITRYNLGAIPIERAWTDVAMLAGQVADELYPAAQARDVAIEVEAAGEVRAFIDPAKMARVLGNMVRNGIAFAERGSAVRCLVSRDESDGADGGAGDGSDAGASAVRIAVENTGREIAPVHLESIFEKFYRADASRGGSGAGLGLAIAKEIVEAHGGRIEAASASGVTRFTVTLPA